MAKKTVAKKPKKNALAGIDQVKPATVRDLEKEAARKKGKIEEGSLEQDFTDFTALINSRGWQRIVFINQENARLLGEQILKKKTLDDEPLDEAACDRLRDQRDAILEFIEFPNKVIERYREAHEPDPDDDLDPYETKEQADLREPKHLENTE